MTAARVLERLAVAGWRATADGGRLVIEPVADVDDLTEEQWRWLADHKTALLAELNRRCCSTCCWHEPAHDRLTAACYLLPTPVPLRHPDTFQCGAWAACYVTNY